PVPAIVPLVVSRNAPVVPPRNVTVPDDEIVPVVERTVAPAVVAPPIATLPVETIDPPRFIVLVLPLAAPVIVVVPPELILPVRFRTVGPAKDTDALPVEVSPPLSEMVVAPVPAAARDKA